MQRLYNAFVLNTLFYLYVTFLGFLPVKDTDFGWHYRCGNELLRQGKLCLENTFSYFLPNYKWGYSSVLYDVGTALTHTFFGFNGLTVLNALLWVAIAYLFVRLLHQNILVASPLVTGLFFLSWDVFHIGFRPQIISVVLFLLLLKIIDTYLSTRDLKQLLVLPFIFFFWVNIHMGFFLGLFILGFLLMQVFYEKKNTSFLFMVCLNSFGATLLSPFTWKVYPELLRHFQAPLYTLIAEWVRPEWLMQLLIIGATLITTYVLYTKKNKSLYKWAILFLTMYLAVTAKRNIPFFYITFLYVLFSEIKIRQTFSLFAKPLIFAVIITSVIFFSTQIPNTLRYNRGDSDYCNKGLVLLPCKLIQHYSNLKGNIFTMYEWGGYLIWKIPSAKVFVDGRMPAWATQNGESPYTTFLNIIQTKKGWNEELRKYKTNYLLIQNGTFLDLKLQEEKSKKYGWEELYRDSLAVLYKKV